MDADGHRMLRYHGICSIVVVVVVVGLGVCSVRWFLLQFEFRCGQPESDGWETDEEQDASNDATKTTEATSTTEGAAAVEDSPAAPAQDDKPVKCFLSSIRLDTQS